MLCIFLFTHKSAVLFAFLLLVGILRQVNCSDLRWKMTVYTGILQRTQHLDVTDITPDILTRLS